MLTYTMASPNRLSFRLKWANSTNSGTIETICGNDWAMNRISA